MKCIYDNNENLFKNDSEIYSIIQNEIKRQNDHLEMIASENITSKAVLEAAGSELAWKYSEGYPNARYYGGCTNVDKIESLAIERVCKLFNCKYANVQPHSGTQANMAVQIAFLNPGDIIMGMSLNSGGHLSHGSPVTFSGKNYKSIQYDIDPKTMLIDYNKLEEMIDDYNPRLLIIGASAYPRKIDFKRISEIIKKHNGKLMESIIDELNLQFPDGHTKQNLDEAMEYYDSIKCYSMADIAHIAGLVATNLHESPFPYIDVVTSTTHKTLRGTRGGIILWNNPEFTKRINSAVFPKSQGGPLQHIIAAKAVTFGEALKPEFKEYQKQVLKNIKIFEKIFNENNIDMITGGTDNHLILLDLRNKDITGLQLQNELEEIGIVTNKNAVLNDPKSKKQTSGLRLGTPAITSRGLVEEDCEKIANIFVEVINTKISNERKEELKNIVKDICEKYPLYK